MSDSREPVVLELASLPREQIGPFILLGVDKDAATAAIEASWAQRVLWARKKQINAPLEDINWAREIITDPDRRVRADAASFNVDTSEGTLRALVDRFGAGGAGMPSWQPRDAPRPGMEYSSAVEVPDLAEVRRSLEVPEVPQELPAVARLLEQLVQEPLDPWSLNLPDDPSKDNQP